MRWDERSRQFQQIFARKLGGNVRLKRAYATEMMPLSEIFFISLFQVNVIDLWANQRSP